MANTLVFACLAACLVAASCASDGPRRVKLNRHPHWIQDTSQVDALQGVLRKAGGKLVSDDGSDVPLLNFMDTQVGFKAELYKH